ncbi:thioredoxin fold domain-containing protein [Desulforhopalus singaporensis]|uniref:Thioredoxin-like n=1 Tax=Desulforhopalus singaporensis TaxID=91360 RepID=A0A1H0IWJ2_9BACT|nr:thioredoxin fold domain-containing protein [Desulforhopalus singaporensis]SDO35878.1 Thioredoxin-like [Desulforhopalus singaporensis]
MSSIKWQTTLGYAEDSAIATRKPILLYFHDKNCIGCREMDKKTMASEEVVNFVNDHLIGLLIDSESKEAYDEYNTIWTPTLIVLDFHGREIQKTVGFHGPDSFLARMLLGTAKVYFAVGEYDAANVQFKKLMEKYPNSTTLPEAIFYHGINGYKQHNDPAALRRACEHLGEKYPESSWAKRATPYANL